VARKLGADHTVFAEDDDLIATVRNVTGGQLADLVIDATPHATQPVVDAMEIVRPGGTIVLAGVKWGREVAGFVSDRIVMKEITMRGVLAASSNSFRRAMQMIASGRHPLHLLHTHRFSLDQAAEAVLTLAGDVGDGRAIAVTINP
jgi:threonine dehydrogenase-like Zn-dependent dehydrogenase